VIPEDEKFPWFQQNGLDPGKQVILLITITLPFDPVNSGFPAPQFVSVEV